MKKNLYLLLLFPVLLSSCISSKSIQKSLNKYRADLYYERDYEREYVDEINCDRSAKLAYQIIDANPLDSMTVVKKESSLVLPFIFFNYWGNTHKITLGESSMSGDSYSDFLSRSLLKESQYSGCYELVRGNGDYLLEITIDSCSVNTIYKTSAVVIFLFFIVSTSSVEAPEAAQASLQLNVKLHKGADLLYHHNYHLNREEFVPNVPFRVAERLRNDVLVTMSRSLSNASIHALDMIIADINQIIQDTK